MNKKTYLIVTGVIFLLVFCFHLGRVVFGLEAVIGGWMVPMWLSYAGILIAGFLAYSAFRLGKETQ